METHPVAYWIGVLIGAFVVGCVCGLLPLLVGRRYGRAPLGIAGFFSCLGAGMLFGLFLALPVAIIFTVIIVVLGKSGNEPPPVPKA
jgi:hypothetical protein